MCGVGGVGGGAQHWLVEQHHTGFLVDGSTGYAGQQHNPLNILAQLL